MVILIENFKNVKPISFSTLKMKLFKNVLKDIQSFSFFVLDISNLYEFERISLKRQELYIQLILIMQKTNQELYDIADRMLANLQKQYWQTQQHNINFDKECPENNENLHEDYQLLDGDDQENDLNDSQSEEHNQEENCDKNEQNQEFPQQAGINQASPAIKNSQSSQKQATMPQSNNSEELMQVFPMPEWVPQAKEVNINCEKIKQFTLTMKLPIPDWVNNEEMLKNRITELFGKKN